jgi:hypothetical protein
MSVGKDRRSQTAACYRGRRAADFLAGFFIKGSSFFSCGLLEGGLEEFLEHFELGLGADHLLVDELLALGLIGDLRL